MLYAAVCYIIFSLLSPNDSPNTLPPSLWPTSISHLEPRQPALGEASARSLLDPEPGKDSTDIPTA